MFDGIIKLIVKYTGDTVQLNTFRKTFIKRLK